ncbi:type VII secretion protein EccB [Nocardia alni]|uniref:type VII secretion protein EccB n=1 Tax=Nocardia alni TaxID=2815723 RepID=UPI001C22B319|nr:type VII secretion protein EccB [Nocardia alni]
MPAPLTTRAQVNGYRYLLRRYDHALIRWDARMLHDPMRAQFRSLVIGAVLSIMIVAGAAILALIHPQPTMGNAKIVMGKDSGQLFVVVNGVLHPALNLASARLIAQSDETPTALADARLTEPRGPVMGIPGAPAALLGSASGGRSQWSVCDAISAATGNVVSTVIDGPLRTTSAGRARPLGADESVLVTRDDHTYLLFDGKRAELDPSDPTLARVMSLSFHSARPVGAGLLNSATPVPALVPPTIQGLGGPGPGRLASVPVGAVIRVQDVDSDGLYVVLNDGVQKVSPFAAEVIRTANSEGMGEIPMVTPDRLRGIPVVDKLATDQFPDRVPTILDAQDDPVTCLSWAKNTGDPAATTSLLAGNALPLTSTAEPVTMASTGDHADAAYVPPGTGEYVQATDIAPTSVARGPLFYITDAGVRYGVPDVRTAAVLGLGSTPRPAPWQIVGRLVAGPMLSQAAALNSYDTLPSAPAR